ncbi:kinase [Clostridium tyrobutyricum]|uniref:GHMP family kinase ATP-binding protein n=1 Tax=Clostridium tyrobutyricum TaxID=1519 RepID=UPI001C38A3AD|nr:kinase [Clostridium tyrobutyricum]MBV4418199.1 kinase [Clostridium tyrobutyricum]
MEVTAFYPGSFGEIIQGKVQDKDLLMSFPINIYTRVRLFECKKPVRQRNLKKSYDFIENIMRLWKCEKYYENIGINVDSNIPKGKGMAGSTADLCAIYGCLLKMFNRKYNEKELLHQCIKIEPTDSIIFSNMTLFDYKYGLYRENFGDYIKLNILAFEGNRTVDTVEFNSRALNDLSNVEDLIPVLRQAICEKDLQKLSYVSTESIVRNQKRLYYDFIDIVFSICKSTGGIGIIGAHSGNILGIIYDDMEKMNVAKLKVHSNNLKVYSVQTLDKYSFYKKRRDCFG